jgi:outer membrane receptor protein involved in Fe transport
VPSGPPRTSSRASGTIWYHTDLDGDGERTLGGECEGHYREDIDCDGKLDPGEDRNQDGKLNDRPRPGDLYPYGHLTPEGRDQDYLLDRASGLINGPYYQNFTDSRRRFTLRQDLSIFVPDFKGSHDLKTGWSAEREVFDRDITTRNYVAQYVPPYLYPKANYDPASPRYGTCYPCPDPIIVSALLPVQGETRKGATGSTAGFYAQDSYRPRPNLSLGVGLRFDQEIANASGYTYFDPAPARAAFDRLGALIGNEKNLPDLSIGDGNGIQSLGVLGDPLFQPTIQTDPDHELPDLADITDPIRRAMPALFIRNHADVDFGTNAIAFLIPDVMRDGKVDSDLLTEKGVIAQEPERFTLTNSNLAPRLSLSWDPGASGKSKLFATWGRYFDKLFLSTVSAEEGPDQVIRYYKFDNNRLRNRIEPNKQIGGPISTTPPSVNQIDRGLQTPFSDELTLGFEREIAPEVALSVTFIDRRYRQQLQDVDVNHYLRINPVTGQPLDVIGRINRLARPSSFQWSFSRSKDGRPDLYNYNLYFNQILRVGNFNEARYRAIEVELRRRLARRWELQASYAYSRAVGAAEDFQSRLGNDPSTTEFEFGYLDYDQRHVVKLNGAAFLPGDWQVGASATWSSGLPYSVISRFFASDNADYQQFRTRFGYTLIKSGEEPRFIPARRNSGRNDASLDINLRARKAVVIGRTAAALFFEVFNVLNSDDLRVLTYEPTPDIYQATLDTRTPQGPLQIDAIRRFGRRFQVGVQIEF